MNYFCWRLLWLFSPSCWSFPSHKRISQFHFLINFYYFIIIKKEIISFNIGETWHSYTSMKVFVVTSDWILCLRTLKLFPFKLLTFYCRNFYFLQFSLCIHFGFSLTKKMAKENSHKEYTKVQSFTIGRRTGPLQLYILCEWFFFWLDSCQDPMYV